MVRLAIAPRFYTCLHSHNARIVSFIYCELFLFRATRPLCEHVIWQFPCTDILKCNNVLFFMVLNVFSFVVWVFAEHFVSNIYYFYCLWVTIFLRAIVNV